MTKGKGPKFDMESTITNCLYYQSHPKSTKRAREDPNKDQEQNGLPDPLDGAPMVFAPMSGPPAQQLQLPVAAGTAQQPNDQSDPAQQPGQQQPVPVVPVITTDDQEEPTGSRGSESVDIAVPFAPSETSVDIAGPSAPSETYVCVSAGPSAPSVTPVCVSAGSSRHTDGEELTVMTRYNNFTDLSQCFNE